MTGPEHVPAAVRVELKPAILPMCSDPMFSAIVAMPTINNALLTMHWKKRPIKSQVTGNELGQMAGSATHSIEIGPYGML